MGQMKIRLSKPVKSLSPEELERVVSDNYINVAILVPTNENEDTIILDGSTTKVTTSTGETVTRRRRLARKRAGGGQEAKSNLMEQKDFEWSILSLEDN
jgi:hypothetical protein